jgi:hypothetical protein
MTSYENTWIDGWGINKLFMEGDKAYYSSCVGVALSMISHGVSGLIVLF